MHIVLKAISEGRWSEGRLSLAAVDEALPDEQAVVGCVELHDYDPLNSRAAIGVAVEATLRGRGYGRAIIQELCNLCTHTLSLHQLYADVRTTNEASRRLFDGSGFVPCGCFRSWEAIGDGYEDVIRYQRLLQ